VPDVEELEEGDAREVAVENARRKALAVVARAGAAEPPADAPVLGVDTVVTLDGTLYGKPADAADAKRMLTALAGRVHEVVSGVAVARPREPEPRTAAATTRVRFRALDRDLLDWYLASGEWRERAGGYAIQGRGAALVAGIEGDYLNVVGLPAVTLLELLPGILHGCT
jgi:septum formation protein